MGTTMALGATNRWLPRVRGESAARTDRPSEHRLFVDGATEQLCVASVRQT